jgi:intracellular multiplication protein IcmD
MKKVILGLLGVTSLVAVTVVFAGGSGIGGIAAKVTGNLGEIAKLITAGSYVAGMAFTVGAIVKFKAHKEAPTQIPIGTPIALLFVGAALLFVPSVMKSSGETLGLKSQATIGGVSKF